MESGYVFTMHDKTDMQFFSIGVSRTKVTRDAQRGVKLLRQVVPKYQVYTSHTGLATEALKIALHGCLTDQECEWEYECSDNAVLLEAFEAVSKSVLALEMCNKHVYAEVSAVEFGPSDEDAAQTLLADVVGYMDCVLDAQFHKLSKRLSKLDVLVDTIRSSDKEPITCDAGIQDGDDADGSQAASNDVTDDDGSNESDVTAEDEDQNNRASSIQVVKLP